MPVYPTTGIELGLAPMRFSTATDDGPPWVPAHRNTNKRIMAIFQGKLGGLSNLMMRNIKYNRFDPLSGVDWGRFVSSISNVAAGVRTYDHRPFPIECLALRSAELPHTRPCDQHPITVSGSTAMEASHGG